MNKIRLKHDSRFKRFQVSNVFGQVATLDLPDEYIVSDKIKTYTQPLGDVMCLAISICAVAEQMTGIDYDHQELFSRIPHNQFGAVPQDAFSEFLKRGIKRIGGTEYELPFKSYYNANNGNLDSFDSIRSSLIKVGHPIILFTNWYSNWNTEILPVGNNLVSGHAYANINGWKMVNGELMLIIDAWTGQKLYMPRKTTNEALKAWGAGTAVFLTIEQDINRTKTILETIKDACINVIILLKQLLVVKQAPQAPITPQVESKPVDVYTEVKEAVMETLNWNNPVNVRNSIRVICDNAGYVNTIDPTTGVKVKDLICAVIQAESNFDCHAINHNKNGSTDYGLVQVNDKYWIGEGKLFKDVNEVFNNPEKSVKFMLDSYKTGHLNRWYGYTNGSYKKFLS